MTITRHTIEQLTESFLTDGLTNREKIELQQLLKEAGNRDYFRKMYILWYFKHHVRDPEDVENALQQTLIRLSMAPPCEQTEITPVDGRLATESSRKQTEMTSVASRPADKTPPRKQTGIGWFIPFLRIAAVVAISFLMGVLYHHTFQKRTPHGDPLLVAVDTSMVMTPLGSRSQVKLPDGTLVSLNAGSTLNYESTYGRGIREVWLEGEGYFKVVTNPSIPFVVKAKDVIIKAMGTEFNVKAYPEETTVQTTLVSGVLSVRQVKESDKVDETDKTGEMMLKPKQTVTIYEHAATLSDETDNQIQPDVLPSVQATVKAEKEKIELKNNIKTEIYTSWKDPHWVFESELLSDLSLKLQRRYDVQIIITDDALKHYPFTGILADETLEQVLDIMKTIAPINYSIRKKTVTLSINPHQRKYFDELMKKNN